jgi:short-subunit dehydrogenase
MDALRMQVRGRGVRVTTLCPGFVRTPMIDGVPRPKRFLLEADEAARRIVRAIELGMAVYRFPWPASLVMRVARCLPDWMIARAMRE